MHNRAIAKGCGVIWSFGVVGSILPVSCELLPFCYWSVLDQHNTACADILLLLIASPPGLCRSFLSVIVLLCKLGGWKPSWHYLTPMQLVCN